MRLIFENAATRARANAWAQWLILAAAGTTLTLPRGEPWAWACLLAALALGGRLLLVRRLPRKIPVLNYHSVSDQPEWLQLADRVSLTPAAFERQLAYLRRKDYRTLFIGEVRDALAGTTELDPRGNYVALTFDDGYADNWIAAFPLLKRYGMKATFFVSTGFIAEAEGCRPTIADPEEAGQGPRDWSGYLTWPELRALQASGLVEVQAHGHAHSRVFAGPELRGFVGPDRPNLWLLWNSRPETRLNWWRELETDRSLWGHPVFRQGPALAHRAYLPDAGTVAQTLAWAHTGGGEVFDRPDWESRLRNEWRRLGAERCAHGALESRDHYVSRVVEELGEARRILQRELGVQVEALCWPENEFSEEGERVARSLGYAITVSNRHNSRNAVGESPERIARVFIGSHAVGVAHSWCDFIAFVLELRVFEGWYIVYPVLAVMHRVKKAVFAARSARRCKRDYVSMWR